LGTIESPRSLEELRLTVVARLPRRARWFLGETPWDWDFSRAARPLEPVPDDDAVSWMEVLPEDWRQMLIFGEEDFAEGGGASPFVSVHAQTGAVVGLDVERERSAAFLLNSSLPAFIETFLLLDEGMRANGKVPPALRDRIRAVDPGVFERSEWRFLVDELEDRAVGA
jgi:hypothetical protein